MTSGLLSKVVPLALLFASGVWAQFDQAECPTGWEWNQNSLNQDPCLIGSMLDASCRGIVVYNYPPLNESQYYLPPGADHTGDLTCDCNTVMYNLYMACSSCQGGQVYSWTTWIAACESVYVSQYPIDIAQGTAVPHWAYFNVTTLPDQTYNDTNAISIGRVPEEFPKEITTTSTESTSTSPGKTTLKNTKTSTRVPGPTGNSSNNTGSSGTRKKKNTGAIVGGVVGTIVPLSILAVLAFFYNRRRQLQGSREQLLQAPEGLDPAVPQTPSMYGPPITPVTATPFAQYNPSDPSTFPPQSPPTSVTYTTTSNDLSHNPRGNYTGIPEL